MRGWSRGGRCQGCDGTFRHSGCEKVSTESLGFELNLEVHVAFLQVQKRDRHRRWGHLCGRCRAGGSQERRLLGRLGREAEKIPRAADEDLKWETKEHEDPGLGRGGGIICVIKGILRAPNGC